MVNTRVEVLLWVAQRATAAILALCVLVHLVVIIHAVGGGLTAAEILGRTRGNAVWAAFYATFALAAAIHAPLGIRVILAEWLAWPTPRINITVLILAAVIAIGGLRAVWAVFH